MASQSLRELRVVLIGPTGAGKSATGNSFMRANVFNESACPQAGSLYPQTEETDSIPGYPGMKLVVIDTPGPNSTQQKCVNPSKAYMESTQEKRLDQTKAYPGFTHGNENKDLDPTKACKKVTNFLGQLSPGPHIIVIVVSAGERVTRETQTTVTTFCEMFGNESTKYMMVLFTKMDLVNTRFGPSIPIKDWVRELREKDAEIDALLKKCDDRVCSIDNRVPFTSNRYQQQIQCLMDMFLQIERQNNGRYYSNSDLDFIEKYIMSPLDRITGSRSKSRKILAASLGLGAAGAAAIAGVADVVAKDISKNIGPTALAVAGAGGVTIKVVGEAGAAAVTAEVAGVLGVSAGVATGLVAGAALATGGAAIAGITYGVYSLYKQYSQKYVQDINDNIIAHPEFEPQAEYSSRKRLKTGKSEST